jgi:hypothetical protein
MTKTAERTADVWTQGVAVFWRGKERSTALKEWSQGRNCLDPSYVVHLAAGVASKVGQTAKARSGYRVQSLREGRDRQRRTYLNRFLSH